MRVRDYEVPTIGLELATNTPLQIFQNLIICSQNFSQMGTVSPWLSVQIPNSCLKNVWSSNLQLNHQKLESLFVFLFTLIMISIYKNTNCFPFTKVELLNLTLTRLWFVLIECARSFSQIKSKLFNWAIEKSKKVKGTDEDDTDGVLTGTLGPLRVLYGWLEPFNNFFKKFEWAR